MKEQSSPYTDMLDLPHHVSKKHPPMPLEDRAAQFAPFSALTGYGEAVSETARLTDARPELDEDAKEELDRKLRQLLKRLSEHPRVQITYFQPDQRKEGGTCRTVTGAVKKLDYYGHRILMEDGIEIAVGDVVEIREKEEERNKKTQK